MPSLSIDLETPAEGGAQVGHGTRAGRGGPNGGAGRGGHGRWRRRSSRPRQRLRAGGCGSLAKNLNYLKSGGKFIVPLPSVSIQSI